MVSKNSAQRVFIVCHVKNADWQLEIDLVSCESKCKFPHIAGHRLEVRAFDCNIAKRINLTLDRFLKTDIELEEALLRRITVLTLITKLSFDENWVVWFEIIERNFDNSNFRIILPIFIFDY